MEATDKSKTEGIMVMPPAILDPPKAGGVKIAPEMGKQRPKQKASIVARKITKKGLDGRLLAESDICKWRSVAL